MSYHRDGLSGTATLVTNPNIAAQAAATAAATPAAPSRVPEMLLLGGLAIGGVLLYRHFKKKGAPTP